ncbi:Serine phosphatase RsbU, regulator of sigma subunit [Nocardioides terrae]|uniref:Serine phosphatase RsbU, regulator of sigma subunit n=1 Tax=Nocardioides terrae TaxID=574651 RepID=A0A1I1GQW1_9ACTN|nr:PP2C family protein-serine/threonine phosphatase [Nocardioides terrae]SFC13682.1 Serine phosphatase RsbU, regulator of sigma subunit [Nocardioides terrae]
MSRVGLGPRAIAALIAAVGIVLTCLGSWTLARGDAASEHRILKVQTGQAASVLSAAVTVIEQPLSTALSVLQVAGPDDGSAFTEFITPYVGSKKPFVSASLWKRQGDGLTRLATTGAAPTLDPSSDEAREFVRHAYDSTGTTIRLLAAGGRNLLLWGKADPRTGLAVYAERVMPADRQASVAANSAYSGLHYAMYVGHRADSTSLLSTDVEPASLPMSGYTTRATIPFGDTDVTLVTEARTHLGSALSRWLPLGVLIGGLLLTVIAALTGLRLARGRRDAEQNATTITALYERVDNLYGQQRELFERLQRALLPHVHPTMPDLEIASKYVAGAHGTEIGGDWYSVVALDEHRFGFVVGDVSGRGVDTVAVMAQARFTVRAYLMDGDEPAVALEKCSRQFDITSDGHMTTVIAGVGDVRTGEVMLASAGHPAPLLLNGTASTVQVPPGVPLGIGPARYEQTAFQLDRGATLFCFTDGLVERRGEAIDLGLDRLAATLGEACDRAVDELVAHAVDTLRSPDASDDIAVLALRRVGA